VIGRIAAGRWFGFQAKNGFAFFHQVESVARDRFQVSRIGFEQVHFPGLSSKKSFLLRHQRLQLVDLVAIL
jgi:hypothetical protein